ncbi:hypothetical protein CASFOL_031270 [Castilleja foliolosa]|uniref:Uncharacterized protein n=1 Tax=Castilleja foliolosa TaxID=1961234 RepID=A0ABD3C759_9LAMI
MEQNETGCQTPQAPVLCVNNCGFFGTASTMNMCSKCYKDLALKQEQASFAASSIQSIVNGTSATADVTVAEKAKAIVIASPQTTLSGPATSEKPEEVKQGPKRCGTCNKRVGLTGFNCRCGNIFCSAHSYSGKHECTFDYRAAGREAISKANPVVKAEKLDKI